MVVQMMGERLAVRVLNAMVAHPPAAARPAGLVLGRRAERDRQLIVLPDARRFEHVMMLGKTGVGKTHALEYLAIQHFERREGFAWLDYHGDPIEHVLRAAARYPDAADRLLLVDLTDPTMSPGLNPLAVTNRSDVAGFRVAAELTRILKQRWSIDAFGARTEELLRNALYTLALNGQTLIEAPLLLTSRPFRHRLVAALTNDDVIAYWQQRYEPLSEPMKAVFREPLLNKITGFLADPVSRHLLGQTRRSVDFARAMREGKWVLINLAKGKLGEHAHTLGNLIFARLQFDIMARADVPESERRVFSIFCDEVQNLAENDLVTLLAEGRKFGAAIVTANQFWLQTPTELRNALLSAGTHMLFRLSAADARSLASELSPISSRHFVDRLATLPRGEAIVRIGWGEPEYIRVPPLPPLRSPDSPDVRSLRARALAHVAVSRTQIDAEIQRRRASWEHQPAPSSRRELKDTENRSEGQETW